MVGTIKRAIVKLFSKVPMNWDLSVPKLLYGNRLHLLASGFSPYKLMCGVVPHISFKYVSN